LTERKHAKSTNTLSKNDQAFHAKEYDAKIVVVTTPFPSEQSNLTSPLFKATRVPGNSELHWEITRQYRD